MNNTRIYWIDNAKFFGILCVIIGHHSISGNIGHIITRNIIFSFHMPLFFFLNGLTKKENIDVSIFIKKRISNLLIPYVIAVLMSMLTADYLRDLIFVKMLHFTDYTYEASDIGKMCLLWLNGWSLLWFIPCLFMCELLFIFTKDYFLKINIVLRYIGLYLCGICGWALNQLSIGRFARISTALIALVFMYLGYDYVHSKDKITRFTKVTFMLFWLVLYISFIKQDVYIDMGANSFPKYPFVIVESVGAIFVIVWILSKTSKIKGVTFWGQSSIIVYLVHSVEQNFIPWENVKEATGQILNNYIIGDILTLVIRILLIFIISIIVYWVKTKLKQNCKLGNCHSVS